MKVILIGGPYNHKIVEVLKPLPSKMEFFNDENIEKVVVYKYEQTPAVIDGYPAYKFIKEAN